MTAFVTAARVNWGDVPTWVSAAASLLALVAAVAAALQAFRLYVVERANQDRAEAEAAERAMDVRRVQAVRVACWMGTLQDRSGHRPLPVVSLRNASDLPIYDVVVEVGASSGEYESVTLPVLPPGVVPVERAVTRLVESPFPVASPRVSMRFRDSAGLLWQRDRDGILVLVAPD